MKPLPTLLVSLCLVSTAMALPAPTPDVTLDATNDLPGFSGLSGLSDLADASVAPVPEQEAFERFYAAIGADVDVPTDAPAGIGTMVDALAQAVEAVHATFGDIEDPDRFWDLVLAPAAQERPTIEALEDAEWLHAQAAELDLTALSDATDRLVAAANLVTATPSATFWADPTGNILIMDAGNDCHTQERMLIIDMGGDDCYDNFAATATYWSDLPAPVSVIVELGGNDAYSTGTVHPGHGSATWGQGVGVGGIGLLVDVQGRDSYATGLGNNVNPCNWAAVQQVYAQGAGVLGVGVLLDATGDDRYDASNSNTATGGCHWNLAYTFAQGMGREAGLGVLVDAVGDDAYSAYARELGDDPDNLAHTYAQGSSGEGIGVLLDGNGDDSRYAGAYSAGGFATSQKGSHAYVFAQASNWKSWVGLGTGPVCTSLLSSLVSGVSDVCINGGVENCTPTMDKVIGVEVAECPTPGVAVHADLTGNDAYTIDARASSPNACTVTARTGAVGQGASGWNGIALLLDADVGLRDTFDAQADSDAGSCTAFSHVYAQGYAGDVAYDRYDTPWWHSNLAGVSVGTLLSVGPIEPSCDVVGPVKVDWLGGTIKRSVALATCKSVARTHLVDSYDYYNAHAQADSGRDAIAHTYAQGMANHEGGRFVTPRPPVTPPGIPPVVPPGIPPKVPPAIPDPSDPIDPVVPVVPVGPVKELLRDLVDLNGATVPGLPALAALTGDAAPRATGPEGAPSTLVPVGIHLDTSGHDAYYATAEANGPTSADAEVYGQGAAQEGLGALAAVGGDDVYFAQARENGANVLSDTHVQAYSTSSLAWPTTPVSACFSFAPMPPLGGADPQCVETPANVGAVGLFVDLFGYDQFSEAAERGGCQKNGYLLGDWPLGPVLGTPSGLGPSFWGTVLTWPCQNPGTATTGNAVSIGADLWTDNAGW